MKKFTIPVGVVIALFLAHPFFFGKEIAATVVPPSSLSQKDLIEVKVSRLIVDPGSMQPVVLIVDQSGRAGYAHLDRRKRSRGYSDGT